MQNRIIPPLLKPGDKVAIAATARKISPQELQPAIDIYKSWGLEVEVHPGLYEADYQFAGTDKHRAQILQQYINDDSVRAVFCARGGYGTVRIIDSINLHNLNVSPKWIVGFSDVTVLHSHIHNHTKIASMHAIMPVNMQTHNINMESVNALKSRLMEGKTFNFEITGHPLNRTGSAKGELVGGNLSVLYSLINSSSDIETEGKILFLEDLDEYLYHIDRMMEAMDRAGKLKSLAGLIIGGMSEMRDNLIPFGYTAQEIIYQKIKRYNYPVIFDFPSGHEALNLPLVMGNLIIISNKQVLF